MLCTSGFMDDVMFGHSGLYGDAWLAALRYRAGIVQIGAAVPVMPADRLETEMIELRLQHNPQNGCSL